MELASNLMDVRKAVWLAPLLMWLCSVTLRAQPPSAHADKARQLVDQLYTPQGLLPIKDLVVDVEDHEIQADAPSNLVKRANSHILYKFPNKLRVEQTHFAPDNALDGKMTVVIRDGANLWIYASGQYPIKKGSDSQQPTLALPFNIQRYRKDSEREYYYLGQETIDGITVHRVQILNPAVPGYCAVLWIDPQRRVPIQMDAAVPDGKGKVASKRVLYKDFRQLEDGRYLPFEIQIFDGDVLKQVKLYKGVKVNVGLEDHLFQPMKEFYRQ